MTRWAAVPAESVEVHRHRCDEGLALAGLHLGDVAVVEHDAAQHLDVERPHAQCAFGGLASDRERLVQEVVQQLAVRVALAELRGLGAQLLVAEAGDRGLQLS